MSEFISACPKCRQQILCDTAYVGQRIACPVCLQEITMPEPPKQSPPSGPNSSPSTSSSTTKGKRNPLLSPVAIGVMVLLLIAGAGAALFAVHKNSSGATPGQPHAPASPLDQCRAIWTCNQTGGSTITDTSGNGNDATVAGDDAAWAKAGRTGNSVLNLGGSSCAETPAAVIDTTKSFTAAVWVNISAVDKHYNQTMVSIDGNQISGFFLMLDAKGGSPRFIFARRTDDSGASTRKFAEGSFVVSLQTWYHVTGVYDADAKTLSLYVNGELQSTTPFETAWQASGKTAIGRGFFNGRNVDYLNGMICDVRIYDRVLTAAEIQALASR